MFGTAALASLFLLAGFAPAGAACGGAIRAGLFEGTVTSAAIAVLYCARRH